MVVGAAAAGERLYAIPHMAYHLTTPVGEIESEPTQQRMAEVLDSIDPNDEEHTDVSLTHESEWSIGVFGSGLVTFEHLEEGEPMHMRGLSHKQILDLWQQLARGEIDALRALPWKPGYDGEAAG